MFLSPETLTDATMKVFRGSATLCSSFVPALFLLKVIQGSLFGSSEELKNAIKGIIVYFILIAGFEQIITILFLIPSALDSSFGPSTYKGTTLAGVPRTVHYAVEVILMIVYWGAKFCHALMMFSMAGMAPVVFLFGCFLGIGLGIPIFFGLIVMASCWPVMWYALDQFLKVANQGDLDLVSATFLEVFVGALKWIGPIGFAKAAISKAPIQTAARAAGSALSAFRTGKSLAGTPAIETFQMRAKMMGDGSQSGKITPADRLTKATASNAQSTPANGGRLQSVRSTISNPQHEETELDSLFVDSININPPTGQRSS